MVTKRKPLSISASCIKADRENSEVVAIPTRPVKQHGPGQGY
jgi:hypothetical protein